MKYPTDRWTLHLFAAASMLACASPIQAAVPLGAAAEIVNVQGAGEQKPSAESDWRPARVAQPLAVGDFVRTRESARMALLFADETQIRLNQNTVLQVKAVASPTQPVTTLSLETGRAWAQTRRPTGVLLNLQTPAATAGIRGTDWDIEVDPDGRTQLTVLSGEVTFSNAHGEVVVGRNEAAVAEVGKAPFKILLTQPRDRIQWVNALRAEPDRFRGLEPAVAEILIRADRQVVEGEGAQAIITLQAGVARFPNQPELRAGLARAQLFADRVEDSARTLGEPREDDPAAIWIARGALARRTGDSPGTLRAYGEAIGRAPQDDRGWYGLGSAHVEREDAGPARRNLLHALELNPQGAGYRGELGTLETFRNDTPAAEGAFQAALADNPSDYIALTGLGLLRLKQGRPEGGLDAFLRAGVMEPRYARAKVYAGVAYYQLGRHADAIATLQQSALLDEKDPLPHLFLAQIYTDLFRAGDAVQASRAAVLRMPYLKSLNQVADDQQGRANFGASLAFFGMEDWALELAQQSYYPYWGGSHLFLADRYQGEFNKNSELFQGFLTNPLAFGGSQRFSSLLQQPGHHGNVAVNYNRELARATNPSATLNGLVGSNVPVAYFVKAQNVVQTRVPILISPSDAAPFEDPTGRGDTRARVATVGLGARPTSELGLFAYYNHTGIGIHGRNVVSFIDDEGPTSEDFRLRQAVVGASYRWSPVSQTWLKLGRARNDSEYARVPAQVTVPPITARTGNFGVAHRALDDVQLRHTVDLQPGSRFWVTAEHVKERQSIQAAGAGQFELTLPEGTLSDLIAFGSVNDVDRRYSGLTFGFQQALDTAVRVDGSVTSNWIRHRTHGTNSVRVPVLDFSNDATTGRDELERAVAPRLGIVWSPASAFTLRAAYQHWMRPLSTNSLDPVETAGLPIEDRLVAAGGQIRRIVVQGSYTVGDDTFLVGRLERSRLANPASAGEFATPSLPFLNEVRNSQLANLSNWDTLESTPVVERGRLTSGTAAVNHMFTRELSGYARYVWHSGTSSFTDPNAAAPATPTDRRIPGLARHNIVIGGSMATARRLYLSARAIYRSERFEDAANLAPLPAGWTLDFGGYWESDDKRWLVGAGVLGIRSHKNERQARNYLLEARYRF